MKYITTYTVLKRLIKVSKNTYGIVKNYDDVLNAFPDIPKEKLFDICIYLSRMLYIDCDYYDEDDKTFDSLIILPRGYDCISNKKLIILNTTLSLVSILIAIISLFVSLTQ